MIEGLKVTVSGSEVAILAKERAQHHARKAEDYAAQLKALDSLNVAGTSTRPGEDARHKIESHKAQAAELEFIANHVRLDEQYQLDSSDLHRLGVSYRGY